MFHARRSLAFVLLVSASAAVASAADPKPKPSHDHKRVLAHVLPDKADLAWTKIPWRATHWDAVIEAQRAKKPILLWAMNGHALACT